MYGKCVGQVLSGSTAEHILAYTLLSQDPTSTIVDPGSTAKLERG